MLLCTVAEFYHWLGLNFFFFFKNPVAAAAAARPYIGPPLGVINKSNSMPFGMLAEYFLVSTHCQLIIGTVTLTLCFIHIVTCMNIFLSSIAKSLLLFFFLFIKRTKLLTQYGMFCKIMLKQH